MDDDIVYTPQEQPDETPTIRELIDQVSHMGDRMNATASAINLLAEQASNPVHQRQEARVNAEAEQSVSVDTAEKRPLDTPLRDMAVPEFEGLLNDVVDRLGRKLPVVTETPQSAPKTTTPNVASVTSVSAAPSQPSVSSSEAPTVTIPPVQTTPTVSNATEATPSQTPKTAPQSGENSGQDKTPAPVSFAHQIRSHAATQTAPGVGA
ncbi:MAG: hypothetical protein IIT36_05685, partial [Aeriscardovia sp.]|nr:hypothetical protein [Aeriscardovia sp.]